MENQNYFQRCSIRICLCIPLFMNTIGVVLPNLCMLYILFFTKYWYLPLLYLIWIFVLDKDTCDTGSRGFFWLRKNFPMPKCLLSFTSSSTYKLDPNKNYLFCCFPHGIIPHTYVALFGYDKGEFQKTFPNHTCYGTTSHNGFFVPFFREFLFAFNACSASKKSLNYLLNDSSGGKAVGLIVGGGDEVTFASEKDCHIVLKKRYGFVKIALKNGSPLVPVFSFGLTSVYNYPQNRFILGVQKCVQLITRSKVVFFYGHGIFQDWFGFVPMVKPPLITIAGEPIDVVKNENPTREDIDELHKKFTNAIIKLFNDHKQKYLPENTKLIIH